MPNPQTDLPDDRLAQLEGQLGALSRRLKRTQRELNILWYTLTFLILGAGGVAYLIRSDVLDPRLVFGSAMPKKLESKDFGLYNRHNQRVVFADNDKWGYPNIFFLDLDLNCKLGVYVYPQDGGSAGIAFYDRGGTRADFRMGENGEALVHLMGEKKKGGILMAVTRDGSPSLTMTDSSGKVLFQAPEGAKLPPSPQENGGRGAPGPIGPSVGPTTKDDSKTP
ncbi:MAG: hypothetical protein U0790_04275 [Isosphaeraceae bacterium]